MYWIAAQIKCDDWISGTSPITTRKKVSFIIIYKKKTSNLSVVHNPYSRNSFDFCRKAKQETAYWIYYNPETEDYINVNIKL